MLFTHSANVRQPGINRPLILYTLAIITAQVTRKTRIPFSVNPRIQLPVCTLSILSRPGVSRLAIKEGRMTQRKIPLIVVAVFVCAIFTITLQPITTRAALNLKSGAVYVLTNQTSNAGAQGIAHRMARLLQPANFLPAALAILWPNQEIRPLIRSLHREPFGRRSSDQSHCARRVLVCAE